MHERHPVGPAAIRTFIGFKRPTLSRADFYRHLGETFMPGTPYMQAPLGLNAYLPAVLDPEGMESLPEDTIARLPDEVALIVYSSLEDYAVARERSLRRRMYTHSHLLVFDMDRDDGGGLFPGPAASPGQRGEQLCWYLFEQEVDWQWGHTELLFAVRGAQAAGSPRLQVEHTASARKRLQQAGVAQLIGFATPDYATLWIQSEEPVDASQSELFHGSYPGLRRHLVAEAYEMPVLEEDMIGGSFLAGPSLTTDSLYTFRFQRDPRFHR